MRLRALREWAKYTLAATKDAISLDMRAPQDRTLFDLSYGEACAAWKATCDSDFGGRSTTVFELDQNLQAAAFRGEIEIQKSAAAMQVSKKKAQMALRYAGFASARSPALPPVPLDDFNAMLLRVRGDGRPYLCNIKTGGDLQTQNDDLYQALLQPPPGVWKDVLIPFGEFVLTWRGSVQPQQPYFNAARVDSIGFGIADREEGKFELNIATIKAVHIT